MNIKQFYFPALAIIFVGIGLATLVPAWVIDRDETELLFGFIQSTEPQVYLQLSIGTIALSALAINRKGYSRVVVMLLTVATIFLAIAGLPGLLAAQSNTGLQINWAGELLYLSAAASGVYLLINEYSKPVKK